MGKEIIVLWNDNDFWGRSREVTVCKSKSDLKKISTANLRNAKGFVVLCELTWDHEMENATSSDLKGIGLVQHYLRTKKKVKAPVVFTSFFSHDYLKGIQDKTDTQIIFTPALQHKFVRLPAESRQLIDTVRSMEKLTDMDLAYTQSLYCNTTGMLNRIIHAVTGRPENNLAEYFKQIEYILKRDFPKNEALKERFKTIKDNNDVSALKSFCETLRNQLGESAAPDFNSCEFMRVLYIEDHVESGEEKLFHDFMSNEENQRRYRFRYTHKPTPEGLFEGDRFRNYEVIISDIELRDSETNELTALGYKEIEKMTKVSLYPLYYLVTNMSRSIYDQIKIPGVRRIRLKSEVFGSEEKIKTFLFGIREVFEDRESLQKATNKRQRLFDQLDSFVRNHALKISNFPFTDINGIKTTVNINNYEEFTRFVKDETLKVIRFSLTVFKNEPLPCNGIDHRNFLKYDKNCKTMRNQIRRTITLGNENLGNFIRETRNPNTEDLMNFAIRMILRSFCLYVNEFVQHYKIDQSFGLTPESNGEFNENCLRRLLDPKDRNDIDGSFSTWDIACRAISTQYQMLNPNLYRSTSKGLILNYERFGREQGLFEVDLKKNRNNPDEYSTRAQSHCMDATLLWSSGNPVLTEEEEVFSKAIDHNRFPAKFKYSNPAIKGLSTILYVTE